MWVLGESSITGICAIKELSFYFVPHFGDQLFQNIGGIAVIFYNYHFLVHDYKECEERLVLLRTNR